MDLDGVGEGESNNVPGLNTGGDEAGSSTFNKLMKPCMRKIEPAWNRYGAAGGKFCGNVYQ